jgi:hypothetical protein
MLHDPAHTDIYSVEGLVAWLIKQPADKIYDYTNSYQCAAAQYLRSRGIKVSFGEEYRGRGPDELMKLGWQEIVSHGDKMRGTYGEAAERGRKVLARKRGELDGETSSA